MDERKDSAPADAPDAPSALDAPIAIAIPARESDSRAETYLGDGLYAREQSGMIILRAPRGDGYGDHWVGLEPEVLEAFLRFVERVRGAARESDSAERPR